VTEVFLAGLAADYCVYFSAKDALAEGFAATIIEDATRAISAAGWEKAKADLHEHGGRLVPSATLLAI
jgi:nicotinamidase/pyrazinamidase